MTTMNKPETLVLVLANINPKDVVTLHNHDGIKFTEQEAAVVLGYLEGHGYHLEYDENLQLHRYDDTNQCADGPYSLRNAVEFCLEHNEELIVETEEKGTPNETYLAELRNDEAILNGLTRKLNRAADKRMSILYDKIKELDWTMYEDPYGWEIRKHSPAGEDFGFYIDECDVTDADNFIAAIRKYAEDCYDAEENAALWIEAKQSGRDSTIPDIRTLIQDADDIQKMLDELVEALQNVRYLWTICYVDPQTHRVAEEALEAGDEYTAQCLFETDVCEENHWDEVPEILMVKCSAVPEEPVDKTGMDYDASMEYIQKTYNVSAEVGNLISNILHYAETIDDGEKRRDFLSKMLDGTGLTEEEIWQFFELK